MRAVPVARGVKVLRRKVAEWRAAGERIALVPTMGALHEGHLSLVKQARRRAGRVVVSIFVNPTQFAAGEDFSQYPRTFEEDRRKLQGHADLIFAPEVEEMYPPGDSTTISLTGPATVGLEDHFRPTHFQGVATVVAKLFIQVQPDIAVFGEKDYQQLKVITRMVEDLSLPVRIMPGATLRERDGLAMSSRNRYLSADERRKAALISATLKESVRRIKAGEGIERVMKEGHAALEKNGFRVDYLEARDAETLATVKDRSGPLRLLVAARLGSTRLIDNMPV